MKKFLIPNLGLLIFSLLSTVSCSNGGSSASSLPPHRVSCNAKVNGTQAFCFDFYSDMDISLQEKNNICAEIQDDNADSDKEFEVTRRESACSSEARIQKCGKVVKGEDADVHIFLSIYNLAPNAAADFCNKFTTNN